jgi:tetratricopeptide (TPR) repeat protein
MLGRSTRQGLALLGLVLAVARAGTARAAGQSCRAEELESALGNPRAVEVRHVLEECARGDPRDPRVLLALGRGYLLEGDEGRAVQWFERAAKLDPGCSECQLWLGRAYGAQAIQATLVHQPALAKKVRKAFERAVELDASNLSARAALVEYYSRAPGFLGGGLDKARREAEEIRRRDALRGHEAFGRVAEHEKRFDAAIQEYESARREFPDAPEPLLWRARLAEHQKDYETAFDLLETVARSASQPDALYEIGRLAAATGRRLDRGEEALKKYLDRQTTGPDEPSLASAHHRLGSLYEKKKDRVLARREYAAALELDPMLTEARQALAKLR